MTSLRHHFQTKRPRYSEKDAYLGVEKGAPPPICAWNPGASSGAGFCLPSGDPSEIDAFGRCVALDGKCTVNLHEFVPFEAVNAALHAFLGDMAYINGNGYIALRTLLQNLRADPNNQQFVVTPSGGAIQSKHGKWVSLLDRMEREMESRKKHLELPAWAERANTVDMAMQLNEKGQKARDFIQQRRAGLIPM